MKSHNILIAFLVEACVLPASVSADEEFYGKIESRPEGKVGTWTIGGRQVAVTEATTLDEEDGPLIVSACAEVEYKGGAVKEIDSEDEVSKCTK